MKGICIAVTILLCLAVSFPCNAGEITPISYIATPGDMGYYPWYDETGNQLTDGVYGGPSRNEPGWTGDIHYNWYPWVGWESRAATITFHFNQLVNLSSFEIHTQRDTGPSVFISPQIRMNASTQNGSLSYTNDWFYVDNALADGYRYTLAENLPNVSATDVELTFFPTRQWILVSEIDFYGDVVPEPSSILALLCGITGSGVFIWRWKR